MVSIQIGVACLATVLLSISSAVDGAKALYVFGDSYLDTGNSLSVNDPLAWSEPYGRSWPGYPNGRYSNGRTQTDFIAEYLKVPSPPPIRLVQLNATSATRGINFAVGGAGVTYAWGHATLHTQVDELEALVNAKYLSEEHLSQSVVFIGMALNNYITYYDDIQALPALIDEVVNGLAYNIWRINSLGIPNIMVTNVAPQACIPLSTHIFNFTKCVTNETLMMETIQHNMWLENALGALKKYTKGIHIILLNQTRAFDHIIHHDSTQGFVNSMVPCCKGVDGSDNWKCGVTSANGDPLYQVCSNPNKSFWWDHGHPTDAGWKAAIELYWFHSGFTRFSKNVGSWMKKYNI